MNMRIITLSVSGLTLVLLIVLLRWPAVEPDTSPTAAAIQPQQPQYPPEKRHALQQKAQVVEKAIAANNPRAIRVGVFDFAEELGGRAGRMLQMAEDHNLSMHFYAKVVDQHNQPVAGASVPVDVAGGGTFAPGSGPKTYFSDDNGMVEIRGRGQDISFGRVKHPQLAEMAFPSEGGSRTKQHGTGLYAVPRYGEASGWHNYESPDHPFLLHVWRVEKFEGAHTIHTGFHPAPNQELPTKRSTRFGVEATCQRERPIPGDNWRNQKGSWSITFAPVGGGIQQTDDFYLYEAPLDGYQPTLTFGRQRGDLDYMPGSWSPYSFYYYYLQDGKKIYGSFEVRFFPYMYDDECRVEGTFRYNKTGSRNLATKSPYWDQ